MKKIFFLLCCAGAFAQPATIETSIDWTTLELKAHSSLNLELAKISMPTGRLLAVEALEERYIELIRPAILGLQVDSANSLGTLLEMGYLSLAKIDSFAEPAYRQASTLSADLTRISASYTINLRNIAAVLDEHTRPALIKPPLIVAKAPAYTGIVILAEDALPVHGRKTSALIQPCLFPKIWDEDMKLIYDKTMTNPDTTIIVHYVKSEEIFKNTPSGMDEILESIVGKNPLRILATGAFGISPTDLIISREDALIIHSSEANRRLLREARVVLALNKTVLVQQGLK